MTFLAKLEGKSAREREALFMDMIGRLARAELTADEIHDEMDMRQLAYLSALARNRIPRGVEHLTAFLEAARGRLDLSVTLEKSADDPLQGYFGATYSMDPGKLRSEGHLHL